MAGVTGETRRDRLTGTGVVTQGDAARTNEGQTFYASGIVRAVAPAGLAEFLITTGPRVMHISGAVSANVDFLVELFEASTTTAPGTVIPTTPRNRNFSSPTANVVSIGPTVTAPGLLMYTYLLPGGLSFNLGAQATSEEAFLLLPNTEYLLRFTNEGAVAGSVSTILGWFDT